MTDSKSLKSHGRFGTSKLDSPLRALEIASFHVRFTYKSLDKAIDVQDRRLQRRDEVCTRAEDTIKAPHLVARIFVERLFPATGIRKQYGLRAFRWLSAETAYVISCSRLSHGLLESSLGDVFHLGPVLRRVCLENKRDLQR